MKFHCAKSILHICLLALAIVPLGLHADEKPAAKATGVAPLLQPFVDRQHLSGAVTLVASKDKILSLETVGYADAAAKKPMSADSLFWIASMSKPMTAAAFMILVDEGRVSLDDPVEKYLPEFKDQMVVAEKSADRVVLKKPVHPITVRNVLNHTSGLPFKSALEQPTLDMLPLNIAVASHAMTPLQFEPDSSYQYSNAGINTAARIIEVITGSKYEDFMQQALFDPLGMKDTTFWPDEKQTARVAKSYKPNAAKSAIEETPISQLHYPLADRKRQPMPAGGLFSTAEDVAKFCQMLLNKGQFNGKQILSESAVEQLGTRQTPPALKNSYGLGFAVAPDSFGHGGAHATNMTIYPDKGIATVWMVQNTGFPKEWNQSAEEFKKWALGTFAK